MNKKKITIVSVILMVIIGVGLVVSYPKYQEAQRNKAANQIAESYYKEILYKQVTLGVSADKYSEVFEKYPEGFNISFSDIKKSNNEKLQGSFEKLKGCKLEESKAKLQAIKPYTEEDVEISINLICE